MEDSTLERPVFVPVRTRRAFEEVCDQIRRRVEQGELAPGARLPAERELAAQFGVNRSAVREALRSLEMAGVVEVQTGVHGGVFIRQGHADGITRAMSDMLALRRFPSAQVTEVRILITDMAIRLACERGTEADFAALEEDIERYAAIAKAGGPLRDSSAMIRFYGLLAQATHNEVLAMLVDSLSDVVRGLLARIDPVPQANVVQVRRKVLRYLRERDADKASAAMAKHLKALDAYIEERRRHASSAGGRSL